MSSPRRRAIGPAVGLLAAVLATLVAAAGPVAAAAGAAPTLYVAKNDSRCSDAGAGTATQPFCSIGAAASRVVAGQTVLVRSGTYNETVTVSSSGTASAPINFTAEPGADVTVAGGSDGFYLSGRSWVTIQGFKVTGTSGDGIVVKSSSHITVRGNRVSNSGDPVSGRTAKGIRIENTTDSLIATNTVDHNTDYGIYLRSGSTRNEVVSNSVYGQARGFERAASGIRVHGSTANTISSNVTHDNEDSGIEFASGADSNLAVSNVSYGNGDHGIDVYNSSGQRLISNSVYNNPTAAGINVEGTSPNATVVNNISVDNATSSSPRTTGNIRVDSPSSIGAVVDYNVVFQHGPGRNYEWRGLGAATLAQFQAASGQEQHGIEADPAWVDPAAGDLHLTARSPAIDSANSGVSGQPGTDAEDEPRVDDPGVPNTGAGPRPYDDRGALERQLGDSSPEAALDVTPDSGVVDLAVTADASASTDLDGTSPIASYSFDFGDGSPVVGPQPGATATHTYRAAGSYTVRVTVTDTKGLSSTASHTVTVTDDPPDARLEATPALGHVPLDVTADASASTDSDGTPIASYSFDWGDGSPATGPQSAATAHHSYATPGVYTVTVTVKDEAGQSSSATAKVDAFGANPPPDAALSVAPDSGVAPLAVTADASGSTDPSNDIQSYSFDWGDGSPATGPQSGATATHTYTAAGSYTLTVTVKDSLGQESQATARVDVRANLVRNFGFESDLSGWNTSGSGSGIALERVSGGHSGDWAARLTNTSSARSTCALNDSPNWALVTSAGTYTGAVWARGEAAGATVKLRLREYSGSTAVGSAVAQATLTTSWQRLSVQYTIGSPGSTLDYNVYVVDAVPGVCLYVDDASLALP
ncbi:MAG: PKD domain-containing protein [Thermoleophilaceae bacterium]|nr:PKD domain-containing protein [Thermoleophilaceae bacterium]